MTAGGIRGPHEFVLLSYARDLIPPVLPGTGLSVFEKTNADPQVPEAYEPAFRLGQFLSEPGAAHLMCIRSTFSQFDMSERMTLSPTLNPSRTSIAFTDERPSLTLTRTASVPSLTSLNRKMEAFSPPCTGRPI